MSVKIRDAVPVALCPRCRGRLIRYAHGKAGPLPRDAQLSRARTSPGSGSGGGGGDRGKNLQAETRCILYRRGSPAKFRFVANITTACQREIKSEVRLAVAVAVASPPGSLFSDDTTLDKPP